MKIGHRVRRAAVLTVLSAWLVIPLPLLGSAPMRKARGGGSTAGYECRRIEGWTVLVSTELLRGQPELADRALGLLARQLEQVTRAVPSSALKKLKSIRIWVEENEPHHACMAYHPDPGWLREQGMSPEKARCVEVANVRNFLDWTGEQKWMVLHELAHAYHHQFLDGGFQNRRIARAYEDAMKRRIYESVARIRGGPQKAYAATNPQEYFAELSEAYFGANDFFPFDRSELRRHDRTGHDVVEALWGARPAPAPGKAARKS